MKIQFVCCNVGRSLQLQSSQVGRGPPWELICRHLQKITKSIYYKKDEDES